jgi:hypothetical protein
MGTRGAVVLVADGQEKTVYNHYDSYPDGLGETVLKWVREALPNEQEISASVVARPGPWRG